MQNDKVKALRNDIAKLISCGASYEGLGRECGMTGNYIRKFTIGDFEPTITRFEAMRRAVNRVKRRNGKGV